MHDTPDNLASPEIMQERLRKSEIRYRRLIETARDGILLLDGVTLEITDANSSMTDLLGYSHEEVIGKELWQIGIFSDRKANMEAFSELQKKGFIRYEDLPLVRHGEKIRDVELVCNIYDEDGESVIQCNIRDVSDRRVAEDCLRETQARLNSALAAGRVGTWTWDIINDRLYSDGFTAEMFSLDPYAAAGGLPSAEYFSVIFEEDRSAVAARLEWAIESGGQCDVECRVQRKDGDFRWLQATGRVECDAEGNASSFHGAVLDITERKQAEKDVKLPTFLFGVGSAALALLIVFEIVAAYAGSVIGSAAFTTLKISITSLLAVGLTFLALKRQKALHHRALEEMVERERAEESRRETEERYYDLVENAVDIIYSHDLRLNITAVNKACESILGYTREEALRLEVLDVVAPEYREKVEQRISSILAGEDAPVYELAIIAKDGTRVYFEINTRVIYDNGIPVSVQGIARNITERKQLENQLRQSQKMESIGVLTGGIAHDFNNLLTVINGHTDLTLRRMPADDPLRHNVEEVREAGERAALLTNQLLAFSRKKRLEPKIHNLNHTITQIESMLRRIVRENIDLRSVLAPELGNINADPGGIEQVIMNLVVNARDAMPNGGTLTIETRNVYLDNNYVSQHIGISPGPFVKMSVTDTGKGMDEENQKRIFEPFFTTKALGKGTGLGLSTVFGIVKQSGGDIMVSSEAGHGTTFDIYLPCVEGSVEVPKWRPEIEEDFAGTETILLVEDEKIVRNLVREILVSSGYNVLEADAGDAAIDVCKNYGEPIHLLLTDVIMPGISGRALREQIVKLYPDIKVLFMSGYTDDMTTTQGMLAGAAFIEKPFAPDEIARKVGELLRN